MVPHPKGIPNCHIHMQPFMGHERGGYYLTSQGHILYHNHHYMNQPFQGAWNQMAQPIHHMSMDPYVLPSLCQKVFYS